MSTSPMPSSRDEEPKVVNGILDKLGHKVRPEEFAARDEAMVDGVERVEGRPARRI